MGTLFDQLSSLRLEIERLDDSRSEVTRQRDILAGRLEELAAKIEKKKADNPDGSLLPDFSLQSMLRKSQEMSASLTLLNRELDALKTARTERLQRLGRLYGLLVEQTAKNIRAASGSKQKELGKVLAKLRRERDLVRRELGTTPAPSAPMDTRNLLASDDPEELSERADAVRDEQARLRRRLASLSKNIKELKADRRLEREMRDFVEDQVLFSEDSRILRVTRTEESAPGMNQAADQSGQPGERPHYDESWEDGDEPHDPNIGGFPGTGESGGTLGGSADIETRSGQVAANLDENESDFDRLSPEKQIQVLDRRRRQVVEQIKKLQILHDRLREKAESLENR